MNNEKAYLFSWVRKGISSQITEVDDLANEFNSIAKSRPSVNLSMRLKATPVSADENDESPKITSTEIKEIPIVGPGDVLSINSNSVMTLYPPSGSKGLANTYEPYIEFWEPDFAWRYTPAAVQKKADIHESRLRPWLALVTCKSSQCSISRNKNRVKIVKFNVDENGYNEIFPKPKDIWKTAHAQGVSPDKADFCRIIGIKRYKNDSKSKPEEKTIEFDTNTEYTAFVIPVFEVTRLRALGFEDGIDETIVQTPAWEEDYSNQLKRKEPFSFPAFFTWTFKTGEEKFETLVEALKPHTTKKAGIDIDVSNLGDGLSYQPFFPNGEKRDSIVMPAATQTVDYKKPTPFPNPDSNNAEADVFESLKEKLDLSPTFKENQAMVGGNQNQSDEVNTDPFVVPPIYGAKHAMATGFDLQNPSWLESVNLDLHYRAVAGLGKKIVQEHQEQFVNRAWKQVDLVKALNEKMHKQLLSNNVGFSIKNRRFKKIFRNRLVDENGNQGDEAARVEFIKNFMLDLQSMSSTEFETANGKLSINQILDNRNIPHSFATTIFQNRTQRLSSKVKDLDLSSVMENIAEGNSYKVPQPKNFYNLSANSLRFYLFQAFLHSRFYVSEQEPNLSYGNKGRLKKNGMKLCPLFDCLSIQKRLPKYINLQNVDSSDLRSLINNVYFFKRKTKEFATYDLFKKYVEHGFPYHRLFVESRIEFLNRLFYEHGATFDEGLDALVVYDQNWRSIASNPLDVILYKILSYGCICKENVERCIKIGNVIGINDDEYLELFGDVKPITRISSLNELLCIVNRKVFLEQLKNNELSPYIELGMVRNGIFDGMDRNYFRTHFVNGPNTSTFTLTDIPPDVINIHEDAFSDPDFLDEYVNEPIESVYDWVELYINNHKNDDEAVKSYLSCKTALDKAENSIYSEFVKQSEVPPKPPKNGELTDLVDFVEEENHKALSESVEIINRYFSAFLTDEEMQGSFIEDCLTSKYPVMAYPQFPEPTYYYLKQLADKFILPCVDELPNNSVTMFNSNEAFVEAFLCGMNTEMGRELLWREYPTDQRGSYFKKFWDMDTSIEKMRKGEFFDIKSLSKWQNELGNNHNSSDAKLLMFAIKGKLMQSYPDTMIYLNKATLDPVDKKIKPIDGDENIISPAAQAFFRDDIYVVGFKIPNSKALGSPDGNPDYGYMLVFKQMMENLNFETDPESDVLNSAIFAKESVQQPYVSAKHIFTYAPEN